MAYRARTSHRNHRKSNPRKRHSLQKPNGVISRRVQKVGGERFGIVCIDPAKRRSKWMMADYFGNLLIEPQTLEYQGAFFMLAVELVRQTQQQHDIQDVIVVVDRSLAPQQRKEALATKRGREPYDSMREPNCPPPQVTHLARSSHAHFGPTSHHCRYVLWSGMQSYGKCRTKPESKCSGKQNTPPQKSEAGSLTKMYGGSCICASRKEEITARNHGGTKVPIDQLTISSVPIKKIPPLAGRYAIRRFPIRIWPMPTRPAEFPGRNRDRVRKRSDFDTA